MIGILAGLAGIILFLEGSKLVGWIPGAPPYREFVAGIVVFSLSLFCFFEAYRFYRFYARPEIRDRYYARHQVRRDTKG